MCLKAEGRKKKDIRNFWQSGQKLASNLNFEAEFEVANLSGNWVLFENRPALYFCNYIFITAYIIHFLIPYHRYCLINFLCIKAKDFI